jgi:RNA polymerase sigma-70 factor (TIGR02960 family)
MDVDVDVLVAGARAGDADAFAELIAPYRAELLVHCYRMLGSFQDAEDALQESMLAAWQGIDGFAGRASMRTWLYRITTNRCLNARRAAARRPAVAWSLPDVDPPEPSRLGEVVWLEPIPDTELPPGAAVGPEARYEASESIALAFIVALQTLPPRQLAVVVLRDVLGFRAREVADMLDITLDAANSALKRGRATLARQHGSEPPDRASASEREQALNAFVTAWEAADVDALVDVLTDDALLAMPPLPLEYVGPDAVGEFVRRLFGSGRRYRFVRTQANGGQAAYGTYLRLRDGDWVATGLVVVETAGAKVRSVIRFETSVFQRFGLPRRLPG